MRDKPLLTGPSSPVSFESAAPELLCGMCHRLLDWTPTQQYLPGECVCKECFDSL